MKKECKNPLKMLGLSALFLTAMTTATGCAGKPSLNYKVPSDCIKGYDGYGSLDTDSMKDSIIDELRDQFSRKKSAYLSLFDDYSFDCISVYASATKNLSNGDAIVVHVDVDEEFFSELGFKIKDQEQQIKIKNLSDPEKIDAADFFEISFNGVNGNGTASITVNPEYSDLDVLFYTDVEVSPSSSLSNQDVITVTLESDSDHYAWKGYKVDEKIQTEYTVEGLSEPTSIDPSELFEIRLSGESGSATLDVRSKSGDNWALAGVTDVSVSKENNLSNGDVVTISFAPRQEEYLKKGYTAKTVTMDYTVSGLTGYLHSFDTLSEDNIEKMKKEAEDLIEARFAKGVSNYEGLPTWLNKIHLDRSYTFCTFTLKNYSYDFENAYITNAKDNGRFLLYANNVYLCYKIRLSYHYTYPLDNIDEDTTDEFYVAFRYDDIKIMSNGEIALDYSQLYDVFDSAREDHDSFYSNLITSESDNYELTDTLK